MFNFYFLVCLAFLSHSLFAGGDYNFDKLAEAEIIVENSHFLPDDIKDYFKKIAKVYDRVRVKNEVETDQGKTFIKGIHTGKYVKTEKDRLFFEPLMDVIVAKDLANYQPYFQRIDDEIKVNGRYATNLFDAFFFDLYGVGKKYQGTYSVEEFQQKFGNYNKEKINGLIEKLKEIGFLKDNSDFSYEPQNELMKVFKRKEPGQISTLIIAGGNIGIPGIESISRYGADTLTLDLSPLEAPDAIVDINDPNFLDLLAKYFDKKLARIEDTSNVSDAAIFKEETLRKLVGLIKPNGHLILSTNKAKEIGVVSQKTANFLKSLGLIPIQIDEHPETKEKLIKGIFQKISSVTQ